MNEHPEDGITIQTLVEATCMAVCGAIGIRFRWSLVTAQLPRTGRRETAVMTAAWSALSKGSQNIMLAEVKAAGWSDYMAKQAISLRSCTARQREVRRESIVKIAMRCLDRDDWMKS